MIQTGYYSLVLDAKTIQLDGYDALTGSDYVTALHQDVTQFTPASLTLKAYQEAEQSNYQPDANHRTVLILDYQVHGLEESGNTVSMVIPLSETLPANAIIRKYGPNDGGGGGSFARHMLILLFMIQTFRRTRLRALKNSQPHAIMREC